jgi:recombination protein RecT
MTDVAEYQPVAQTKAQQMTTHQLLKKLTPEIARALPRGMEADRISRLVMTEIRKSENSRGHSLTECTMESFAGSLLTASALGLEPGVNGECYLVPYEDRKRRVVECQLIIGYQGIVKLFWQHPRSQGVKCEAVYSNDKIIEFTKGTGGKFVYQPTFGDRGEIVCYYAEVTIAGVSEPLWDVFTPEQIKNLRRGKVGSSGDVPDPERWMERKGLALDTPLPTPTGWTNMGDIAVGDEVYDMHGMPARVSVVSEVKNLPCYQVTFANGEQITCDHEHYWVAATGRNGARGGFKVHQIGDLYRAKLDGKTVTVPVAGVLTADVEKLPIDPWLLGYWLGNGRHDGASVTCNAADVEEVSARITGTEYKLGAVRPDIRSNAVTVGIKGGLKVALRENGILGTKRIPDEYRRASVWQRQELLSGLVDSDGHICKNRGRVHFTSTDLYLTDLVAELASSLGEVVYRQVRTVSGYGKTVTSYEAHWKPCWNVATLTRKAANYQSRIIAPYRSIKSIEVVESVPTQCIAVDSPTRTYLAGRTMVPTHNTALKQVLKLAPKTTRLDMAIRSDERNGTELARSQALELPSGVEQTPDYVDGEFDEQTAVEPTPEHPDVEMVTTPQTTKLAIIRDERYAKTAKGRADWFKWVATTIGREIDSNTKLTKAEAMVLLDVLEPESQPTEGN